MFLESKINKCVFIINIVIFRVYYYHLFTEGENTLNQEHVLCSLFEKKNALCSLFYVGKFVAVTK